MSVLPFLDRRAFVAGLTASVVAVDGAKSQQSTPKPGDIAQPLPAPDRILRAGPVSRRILPDPAGETPGLGFNNSAPAPVLHARRGEPFALRLENGMREPTSLHWYGLHGANAADGVVGLTQPAVKSGETFDYQFTPSHSGTLWFQSLAQGYASSQLDKGLAGVLIVEEDEPPPCDRELVVLLDDWRLGENGAPVENYDDITDACRSGRLGNRLTVNGHIGAETISLPPRSRVRLRIVNICNARILPMRFLRVGAATVIGLDGQPTEPFDPLRKQVILAPGSRFDVMIDLPAEPGQDCMLVIALAEGLPVVRLVAEGKAVEARPPVQQIPPNDLPPAITLQNAERATLEIGGGLEAQAPSKQPLTVEEIRHRFANPKKIWTLNGGAIGGFSGPPLMRVKQGRPCVVAVTNKSAWVQVIHIHGHHFRYLHPFDDGWEPYWIDTLVVAAGQTIRVAFDAAAVGKWAIRSSVLEHFESGVATWFEVS